MRRLTRLAPFALTIVAGPTSAHDMHAPAGTPPGWTWDPWIVVPMLLSALLFVLGWYQLRQRSTLGVRALDHRCIWFACGWLTLVASLNSPLHQAGERSFAAHMFEHELLMLLAAPLLVLSEPLAVMLWALPGRCRRTIGAIAKYAPVSFLWSRLTEPVTATLIQAAVLWGWHAPTLFDLALSSAAWHAVQHLSFLVSALLFWTAMIGPRRNAARGLSALCLFATSVVSGALGALMAFSLSPWYLGYARLGMAPFGLTPAEDQQLAGLIMWVPGGLVHAGAALVLVATMLNPPAAPEAAANGV